MLPMKAHPLLRVLLAACITALLLGDVWRSLHLLHARHVLCPEHGELVDADDALALAGGGLMGAGSQALPGGTADHHHEHCGLAAAPSRSSLFTVASAGPSVATSVPAALLLEASAQAVTSQAVLAYAPKQSPPIFAS